MITAPTIRNDGLLRRSIRLDGLGTGVIGLAIAAFAGSFAELTGLRPAWSYSMAVAFIGYGVAANWLAGRPNIRPIGTGLCLFNFVGTAALFAAAAAGVLGLTGAGKAVMVAFGLYTLIFGVLQLMGLRRLA